jgi:TolA-binding protein
MTGSGRGLMVSSMIAVFISVMLFAAFPGTAHAGFIDGVKGVFGIPGDVDKLKEQYQEVKSGYDSALLELDEAKRRTDTAIAQAEDMKKIQEGLLAQNAGLAEQNRKLAETVEELEHSQEARDRQAKRVKTLVWTLAATAAGLFAATRAARYIMRARVRG